MNTNTNIEAVSSQITSGLTAACERHVRHRSPHIGIFAMSALAMMSGMSGRRLAAKIRNDPGREKTPYDLERIAAAQNKQERKAALRCQYNIAGERLVHPVPIYD